MKKELFEELSQSIRDGGPPTGNGHSGSEETTADS